MPNVVTNDAPAVIVRPTLLKPHLVVVGQEHELVTITINDTTMKMGYEDAFKLSQWIRMRAKQAKAFAGDRSRNWRTLGILEDIADIDKRERGKT